MNIKQINSLWPDWEADQRLGSGSYGEAWRLRSKNAGEAAFSAVKILEIPSSKVAVTQLQRLGMNAREIKTYLEYAARGIEFDYKPEGGAAAEDGTASDKGAAGPDSGRKPGNHPHLVEALDLRLLPHKNAPGWTIAIQMENLESLAAYATRSDGLSLDEIVQLGFDISEALEECERSKIPHRNIKPDNIFRTADGHFKLGDYGIAGRITEADVLLSSRAKDELRRLGWPNNPEADGPSAYSAGRQSGAAALSDGHGAYASIARPWTVPRKETLNALRETLSYMAPETALAGHYDSTADIYSLGLILYTYLNGWRFPFYPAWPQDIRPDDIVKAQTRRLGGAWLPAPMNGDTRLAAVICQAAAPNPSARFENAASFRAALEAWRAGRTPVSPEILGRAAENADPAEALESYVKNAFIREAPAIAEAEEEWERSDLADHPAGEETEETSGKGRPGNAAGQEPEGAGQKSEKPEVAPGPDKPGSAAGQNAEDPDSQVKQPEEDFWRSASEEQEVSDAGAGSHEKQAADKETSDKYRDTKASDPSGNYENAGKPGAEAGVGTDSQETSGTSGSSEAGSGTGSRGTSGSPGSSEAGNGTGSRETSGRPGSSDAGGGSGGRETSGASGSSETGNLTGSHETSGQPGNSGTGIGTGNRETAGTTGSAETGSGAGSHETSGQPVNSETGSGTGGRETSGASGSTEAAGVSGNSGTSEISGNHETAGTPAAAEPRKSSHSVAILFLIIVLAFGALYYKSYRDSRSGNTETGNPPNTTSIPDTPTPTPAHAAALQEEIEVNTAEEEEGKEILDPEA